MFGLELWFVLAMLSTISGGIASFVYKVASVKNHNPTLLTSYASFFSAGLMLTAFLLIGDFRNLLHPMLIFALVSASIFFVTNVIKIEALKSIDTAIFFPLYKVTGPLVAILIGLFYFSESFSNLEWLGLILSLLVPVLLITKAENIRQKDLVRGLWLVLIAAIMSGVAIGVMKEGTNIADNIWGFIVAGEIFTALTGMILLLGRHQSGVLLKVTTDTSKNLLGWGIVLGFMHALGAFTLVFAFYYQGPLGIVYTINSLYILIPIILSIIFYNEHWNARKVAAIVISIVALWFLK